jgi:hypothetical protein
MSLKDAQRCIDRATETLDAADEERDPTARDLHLKSAELWLRLAEQRVAEAGAEPNRPRV